MTTILALETSRSLCSVAVQTSAGLAEDTRKVERLHNEVVLSMVDDVCERAALAKHAIDVVAFGAGPGSFTGVRIAAAVAQGIAFGAGAVVVPVPSSLAIAHGAVRQLPGPLSRVVTMTRSRRDAFYLAGYAVRAGVLTLQVADALCSAWPAEFQQPGWVAVGDKPPWWGAAEFADDAPLEWGDEIQLTAGLIAELGLAAYAAGNALEPARGLPIYVQGDSPWRGLRYQGS